MSESEELARLAELHDRGVLTDEEFSRAKARVLGGAFYPHDIPVVGALNALRRSRYDRWFGGVCGGIGRSTDTPPWVWRLIFTLLVLCGGTGFLAYLLLWLFVPIEPLLVRSA